MRPGMSNGHGICLYDSQSLHRLNRVKILCRLPCLVQRHTFGNGDHLREWSMRNGGVALVILHIRDLLHDVADSKTAKISRIRLAAAIDQVALTARVICTSPAFDDGRWRHRMPIRKPVNGCGISVDLRKRKLLFASRKMKQRSVILSRVANAARIWPRREVGAHKILRGVVVRLRCSSLIRMKQAGTGEDRDHQGRAKQNKRSARMHDL